MTDRIINLRDWEAAALNEGRATALVRVCKPQPVQPEENCHPRHVQKHPAPYLDAYCGEPKTAANPRGMSADWYWWQVDDRQCLDQRIRCPFGSPGDAILGRENYWRFTGCDSAGKPWGGFTESPDGNPFKAVCYYDYPQMGAARMACAALKMQSVTMPKWAIRARYTNAGVRCMRVQELSTGDMWECGMPASPDVDPAHEYAERFGRDHGPGAWSANPWIFFARLTK